MGLKHGNHMSTLLAIFTYDIWWYRILIMSLKILYFGEWNSIIIVVIITIYFWNAVIFIRPCNSMSNFNLVLIILSFYLVNSILRTKIIFGIICLFIYPAINKRGCYRNYTQIDEKALICFRHTIKIVKW